VVEFFKHIEIVGSYLSAIDLIENLQENESVENFGQLLSFE
jgi:hypothetical protein